MGDGALRAVPAPSGGTWGAQCDSLLSAERQQHRPARHAADPGPAGEGRVAAPASAREPAPRGGHARSWFTLRTRTKSGVGKVT